MKKTQISQKFCPRTTPTGHPGRPETFRSTLVVKTAFASMALLLTTLAPSHAALMAYEGFNYSTGSGNLTGLNGGFGWNGSWQGVVNGSSSVQASSLTAGASAPAGYDSHSVGNSAFTPNGTRTGRVLDTSAGGSFGVKGFINGSGNIGASGKTLYISFVQQPGNTNNNYYEFELHRGSLNDPGRIGGVGCDTSGSSSVYLRTPSVGQNLIGAGSLAPTFYVVRIDFLGGNDTVTVYQNPTSATEPASPTLVETGAGDMSFNGISFGAFNSGETVAHDEVRLGETWNDVTSPGVASTGLWVGSGANNNWSSGGNWDNGVVPTFQTSLTFAGSAHLNNTNDLTGVSANSITFDSAAGAFTLNGNSLGFNGNIGFNGEPATLTTQTINLALTPNFDFTVGTRTNGNITFNGNITGVDQLTQAGPDNTGIVTLAGTNSLKGLVINNSTNIITGNTLINGIGGSSFFYVPDAGNTRNATLIIQNGATLTVTNGFQDAGVIARDGANGRIIQNGGTFNFAINDGSHNFLFVGASGQANAHAEYDMNGGLLDMHGDTLGIALGVNAGNITGVVSQTGGVITNVLNLYFSPFFSTGNGIYNLTGGSIYIGTGGITVFSGGTYQMNLGGGTIGAEASWSSALNMTLTGTNGPVTFSPGGNTITLSGGLTGTGGLTVAGSGTLELSGANTYSGDTLVNGGTLQLDTTGSSHGKFRIANGAVVNLNFSGNYAVAGLFTNGVALAIGTYNSGNLPGFLTGGGNLVVSSSISTGLWTGGGADNNWSTAGNWDQNAVPNFPIDVTFAGSTRLVNNNNLSSITAASITFNAAAGAFVIGGNDIGLAGNIGFSGNPASPITQTVNLNMTWNADKTIDAPTNGNLTLGGNITTPGINLTKTDGGTLTLGGSDNFSGFIDNGGTVNLTGSTTINGTGGNVFYLGNGNTNFNGKLVVQNGAALNITGSFGDALVIGRNGGSGSVVQNGGTVTYAPANQTLFLVGATSNPGTQAEYDMNGGTLDLNGNTLGLGLGDAGVTMTGVVNQTSGNIINVFKLDLGTIRSFGYGVYTLSGGSITIDFGGIVSDDGLYALNLGGGTIAASSSWISSVNMNLTNLNGSVTFNPAGNTILLSGSLSGTGGLIVGNSGVLELSGANSYSGDTVVTAGGTLQLDATGSSLGALRMANGALLNLNFSGNYVVPAFFTNGVALAVGTYNASNLPGFILGSGNLQVVSAISTGLWTGLGANNNWSTGGNWDHNVEPIFPIGLTFAGSTRLANNNDLTSITASSITFDSAAGAFVLSGNDITLGGNIGFNGNPAAPITQTVNLNMAWGADKTVNLPANGNLSLGGNITSGNNATKVGNGTLTLGGVNALENLDVDGGTNTITGTTTINGNGVGYDRCYVGDGDAVANCNGTLVIQPGGTFSVTGNFNDALVIGRDGGTGKVIQNGGTFTFNPANNQLFLVGASGNSGTRAEYHMNGGLFDMSNFKLGIGLGVNGAGITGAVYQVSGVITNVGNLDLGTLTPNGRGEYNLTGGSIYIGSGGITTFDNIYAINLGGGTIGAEANWSSTLNMSLTGSSGPVTFDTGANNITLSGTLSGSGGVTKAGSGILELAAANTYTGNTVINAGTLKLDAAGTSAGAIQIANGALVNLNYSGTRNVPSVSTNGIALASGVYTSINLPAFISGPGSLTIAPAAPPAFTRSFISGGNLILTGSGGTAGAGYTWLTTTNLTTPIALWTTNSAGNFDSNGNFSNGTPVSATTPARFFRLRTP